jgi:Fic family protein
VTRFEGEEVRAFVPAPLPPAGPALRIEGPLEAVHSGAIEALGRLSLAGEMVPSAEWFLYGFVRKEAVVTSQIEGTEATLRDVVTYEATRESQRPDDVREVCNYVDALLFARREVARARGLPLSTRLLCGAHKRLMRGVRGQDKQPGELRRSQNWIGGIRPGNARFVPPPPELVAEAMAALDKWIHADDPLPPLVRAGLAHVQFETIHPFLDGNGRIGRLLVALLLEHWGLTRSPLLYLSVALRRRQQEYYRRLAAVRTEGDWEGWTAFFLECVRDAADDGVAMAQRLFALVEKDRRAVLGHGRASVASVRLLDALPSHPVVTLSLAGDILKASKPTAAKAIEALVAGGVLRETTGRRRDRVYAYQRYLDALTGKD